MDSMTVTLKVVLLVLTVDISSCTIDGLTYMDPIVQRNYSAYAPGEDPCHPLYWYPRHIPEYCLYKTTPKDPCENDTTPAPIVPLPVPVPQPVPVPLPMPPPPPMPVPLPIAPMPYPLFPPLPPLQLPPQPPMPLAIPVPHSYVGAAPPPLPFGVPLEPTNPMIPVGGLPYPYMPPYPYPRGIGQVGMVPGVPGIVSRNGGINVLPFSDVYSDMLQSHRQHMINSELKKLVAKYDRDHYSVRGYRKYRRHSRRRH